MRAAMSHKFGREYGRGSLPWVEDGSASGHFLGNPSVGLVVSEYMISLRRRKVHSGEVVTSARAIDNTIIKKLYDLMIEQAKSNKPDYSPVSRRAKEESPESWAGSNLREMLHALYLIAFFCLLRFDEALRIEWHWITIEPVPGKPEKARIRLQLPYRKTHQTGGISPFILYGNSNKPWLDPVLAVCKWRMSTLSLGLPAEGFVFRRRFGSQVSDHFEKQMSDDSFLECFRNSLCDIHVNPQPYGTHSFRRGGAQYLVKSLRWPITRVCSWGGWSDRGEMGTLFKYLVSWTDEAVDREDYFNPDKQTTERCPTCGRSCMCS
ncbi:hypothetical protein DENSPDRAFT_894477 [Dentipellis sp. KUC8613]|nr:hypothetical protein DENSPDRAFT_894477 [Dentipellis sp. KUC8613]